MRNLRRNRAQKIKLALWKAFLTVGRVTSKTNNGAENMNADKSVTTALIALHDNNITRPTLELLARQANELAEMLGFCGFTLGAKEMIAHEVMKTLDANPYGIENAAGYKAFTRLGK